MSHLDEIPRTPILELAASVGIAPPRAGLNKGEARNSLARAVFFNRPCGKSGLSLSSSAAGLAQPVTAAIVLPTRYRERATQGWFHGVTGGRRAAAIPVAAGWEATRPTGGLLPGGSSRKTKFRPFTMPGKTWRTIFSEFCGSQEEWGITAFRNGRCT